MSASPWSTGRLRGSGGPALLFGATYEDAAIDDSVLGAAQRVFAIAASGDTVLRLARPGRHVLAVDVNPRQAAYVRHRLAGGRRRRGRADRLLAAARVLGRVAGWTPGRVARFCDLCDVGVQAAVFDRVLDTARFRAMVDTALAPAALLRAYRPSFVSFLPTPFGPELRRRLRRCFATHPNRGNPYVRLLLRGEPPAAPALAPGTVTVHTAEAAAFLEQRGPGTFDGFTLSNVLDGPGAGFRARLAAAVAHAGTPGAPVVLRTLRRCHGDAARWARRDRALIWGGVIVTTAARLPAAVEALR